MNKNVFFAGSILATILAVTTTMTAMAQSDATTTQTATQTETETQITQLQAELAALRAEFQEVKAEVDQAQEEATAEAESEKKKSFYMPQMFGAMMATLNVGTYDGLTRFNVRNSRFGIKGNASRDLSYQLQIDFHNQGSVSVLDAYMSYKLKNFGFKLGQQHINLSEDLKRGPNGCLFTTRSFTAIASTAYVSGSDGDYSLKSLGSRDIGAYVDYSLGKNSPIPINLGVGVFNGSGANNPEWSHSVNVSARVILGDLKQGFSGGSSIYTGTNSLDQDMTIWTGEARYVSKDLFVESTVQQRRLQGDDGLDKLFVANIQGFYNIHLDESKIFDYIAPTLRWDMGYNMSYMVEDSEGVIFDAQNIDANRLTVALNFRFKGAKLRSRMLLGYEFIFTDTLADATYNELMQDKFTFGLICAF